MKNTKKRILLVEDDHGIRRELLQALGSDNFSVQACCTGKDAQDSLENGDFDLILLDLGLPDADGIEICKWLRSVGNATPIIIITARDAVESRIEGLNAGADDYVVKPFQIGEVVARMQSVLRRATGSTLSGRITLGDLWADSEARKSGRDDREFRLKPREFDLLFFLLQNPGRAWTREQLLARVWGPEFEGDGRTVDLHVRRLRQKIEDDASDPRFIETVWGIGYRMSDSGQGDGSAGESDESAEAVEEEAS